MPQRIAVFKCERGSTFFSYDKEMIFIVVFMFIIVILLLVLLVLPMVFQSSSVKKNLNLLQSTLQNISPAIPLLGEHD